MFRKRRPAPLDRVYRGFAPYRDDPRDVEIFHGRRRETKALAQLITAEPVVVVYGTSGVGKTSLLQAGVSRLLRARAHLPVMVRISASDASIAHDVMDAIRLEATRRGASLANDKTYETLWEFLSEVTLQSRVGRPLRPAIVIDQFEELFTMTDEARRNSFLSDLANVIRRRVPRNLEEDYHARVRKLRREDPERQRLLSLLYGTQGFDAAVVLALREDRLGELQALRTAVPAVFSATVRVLPLNVEDARLAIEKPPLVRQAQGKGFVLGDGAADEMLAFLSSGSPDEGINPAQLQVLCSYVDDIRLYKSDPRRVDARDLGGVVGMQRAMRHHYRRALGMLPLFRAGPSARRLRPSAENFVIFHRPRAAAARLIEIGLLTRSGWRTPLVEDVIRDEYGISDGDMSRLEDARLVVADQRRNRRFYELAHDSLAASVLRERARRHRQYNVIAVLSLFLALGCFIALTRQLANQWQDVAADAESERDPMERARMIVEAAEDGAVVELQGLRLQHLDLTRAAEGRTLARLDFRGADLSQSRLEHLTCEECFFDNAHLAGASLRNSHFRKNVFFGADLRGASLAKTRLIDSDLSRADLSGTNLAGTAFAGCNLLETSFAGARSIAGASFEGTAWWEGRGFTEDEWRSLEQRWSPRKLATSHWYRDDIRSIERERRWSVSRYTRAVLANELAFKRAVRGFDLDGALKEANAAVAGIADRRSDSWLDRFFRPNKTVRRISADIHDTRGYIHLLRGDVAAAERDLTQCIRDWNRDPACSYHLSLAAMERGDEASTERWRKRAQELGYVPSYERMSLHSRGVPNAP